MVSVIIPAYNRAHTLRRSVESVLAQTYDDLEVIVVDDGSTDSTEAVVRAIPDARVRYVRQINQGACAARNHGVELARGEYIAFQDSDDLWYPDKLEKQLRAMREQNAAIVCCRLAQRDADGSVRNIPVSFPSGFRSITDDLFGIGTQTLLARREVFGRFRFDPEMPRFQEFELLVRIVIAYPLYCMNDALVEYSIGDDSISASPEKLIAACDLLQRKHPALFEQMPTARTTLGYLFERTGQIAYEQGDSCYKAYLLRACAFHRGAHAVKLSAVVRLGLYPLYIKLRALKFRRRQTTEA